MTENNKEQSNDFSWLDKMVSGFDCSSKESENSKQKSEQHKPAYFAKRRPVLAEQSINKYSAPNRQIARRSLEKGEKSKSKLHKAAVSKG